MSTDDILRDVEEMGKRALELEEAVGRVCVFASRNSLVVFDFFDVSTFEKNHFEILPKICVYFELKHY